MKQSWINGLDEQEQRDLRGDFLSSHLVRKRLTHILEKKIQESLIKSRSPDNYESPNWDRVMADSIGYQRALSEIIKLIE